MENLPLVVGVTLGLVFLFLASGMWISIALGTVGVILLVFFVKGGIVGMVGMVQFNTLNSFTYITIPLFIFMGEIIVRSGMSGKLYKGAAAWVGWLPGGLLHTNILACSIFAAVSGSSVATAAAIGTVAIPELEARGYNRRLVTGSLAAGGTLGILIPPSIAMIIYGVFVEQPIGKLFIAGVFPGMILAGLFMLYIGMVVAVRPHLAPERLKLSLRAVASSLVDIGPMVLLILMVLGTIYLGITTPTEAAAIGSFIALVLCVIYRKLTWQLVKQSALEAVLLTSWILLIVIAAQIMSMALSYLRLPAQLSQWVAALKVDRLVILTLVAVLYVVLGMFIDGISMMLLTLSTTYPLMISLKFNPLWFGVMLVLFVEMALITPPVGVNLFVINGITGRKYLSDIIIGSVPFVFIIILMLIILTVFPELATWLPSQMSQRKW